MAQRLHVILHFAGAGVNKLAPPLVQFALLLAVARSGTLDDVGLLALGSAVAFLCGGLAELGLATSLSIPGVAFGTEAPPLRATRRLRVGSALLGSVAFGLLWAAGLGGREPALLLAAPLPIALALTYGYSGAMNATGRLRYEIPVTVGESGLILAIALAGATVVPALEASLAALTLGRGAGTVARMLLVRRMPQSPVPAIPGVARIQAPFLLATVGWVLQGQADIVALGFVGSLAMLAVYAPLVRTAYSALLSAEASSWALFGGANPDDREGGSRLARRWRPLSLAFGVAVAGAFVALAHPFLEFLLDREVEDVGTAVLLFGIVIVMRFAALTLHVDIVRAGRQRAEVPVLGASALVLAVAGGIAAGAGSLTWLAAARLGSEVLIAAGFLTLRQGAARVAPRPPPPPPASDGRLRILVLSPFPPRLDGAHGGARVIAHMAAELGDRMRVALLCLRHPSEAPVDAALRARVERVEEVARPDLASAGARMARFVRWRLGLLAGRPFWVSDLRQRAYAARLTALVAELRPHVVEIEYPAMAQYLPIVARSGAALVLAEYDPEAGRRERGALLRRLDARAWRLVRRRALRAVDAAIVVTERDRGVLEPLAGPTPLVRIPFGTDFAERSFATGSSDGGLLFVGNFVHPPNVDAARRLVTSIYPAVRERRPDCVLHVVGDGPPADLTSAGVVLTGRVAAVEPYLERAAVVVVPLREGGGMRVKVLEALAAGKAVVASPLAVEGLDVVDGRDLVVAGTDEEFARHVLQLLEDPAARDALGRRARAWAQDNLTWRASVEARGRLYAELLAARRG